MSPAAASAPASVSPADVRERDAHDIILLLRNSTVKIFPKSLSIRVPVDQAWTRPGLGIKTPRFDGTAAARSPVVEAVTVEVVLNVVEVVVVTIVRRANHPTARGGIRVRIFFWI